MHPGSFVHDWGPARASSLPGRFSFFLPSGGGHMWIQGWLLASLVVFVCWFLKTTALNWWEGRVYLEYFLPFDYYYFFVLHRYKGEVGISVLEPDRINFLKCPMRQSHQITSVGYIIILRRWKKAMWRPAALSIPDTRGLGCDPWSESRDEKWAVGPVFLFFISPSVERPSQDGPESIQLLELAEMTFLKISLLIGVY